jgi:hypothetical protein
MTWYNRLPFATTLNASLLVCLILQNAMVLEEGGYVGEALPCAHSRSFPSQASECILREDDLNAKEGFKRFAIRKPLRYPPPNVISISLCLV